MEGHGIKVEWMEGIPGVSGSTVLMVSSINGQIAFTQGQASVLLAEISHQPQLVEDLMFRQKPFLVTKSQGDA